MTYRAVLALLATTAFLTACGDDDDGPPAADAAPDAPPPPADISYPAMGPLSSPAGKGSFRFGAASAATQIEDQNPNTDWYLFTRPMAEGGLGHGFFVGDAAMGYTKALDDVQLLKDMHLDSYRFSIEWARVQPTADGDYDEAALQHYDAFIDALVAAGIRPVITIHHFSFPVWVDDPRDPTCASGAGPANYCGLGDPQGGPMIVLQMARFAGMLAARYGDRVDEWGTVNEPINYLLASYGLGYFPPGKMTIFQLLEKFIPVVRDMMSAHAAMYTAIKEADTVDADGDGVAAAVGMSLAVAEWTPADQNFVSEDPIDVEAVARVVYVYHHLFVDSMRDGTFDADLDGTVDEQHPEWKGTMDWLGLQYYFRTGVTGHRTLVPVLELTPCFGDYDLGACVPPTDKSFCVPDMGYEYYPPGLYNVLKDFGTRYPNLPLVVTESGIATRTGERRAENVVRALEQIDRAVQEGIDVRGYYHWSLYDNFEWQEGFTPRFGLYTVDYENGYGRTATLGATVLGDIAEARKLSSAQRSEFGGLGPMTPETGVGEDFDFCSDLHHGP
jgi:beta-glucosidase/6-phospho-beta-glucosidase/beta-galactosidase